MPPRRALRPDAEVAVSGHVEPLLLHGGATVKALSLATVKALSLAFLADFEQHWRVHGREVLDRLAEKYPQAYFGGAIALAKVLRWETDDQEEAGAMTPEEIMDKLEQRVGPKGRKLFEQFLRPTATNDDAKVASPSAVPAEGVAL
jgi:hypothetical protein